MLNLMEQKPPAWTRNENFAMFYLDVCSSVRMYGYHSIPVSKVFGMSELQIDGSRSNQIQVIDIMFRA